MTPGTDQPTGDQLQGDQLQGDGNTAHVLITRFNLATPGREATHRQSPNWLAGRFDLFERYCLPSVCNQTQHDFIWLILFDIDTPDWARERIERNRQLYPFTPVFTPLFDNDGWGRFVREAVGPPVPGRIVVTSNLDNDDAIANDYLERLRLAARRGWHGGTFALNVTEGLILAKRRFYRFVHPANAFTTLVEADEARPQTTMTIRHNELRRHVRVVQVGGGPGWLQIVHTGNVSNRVRGVMISTPQAARFPGGILAETDRPATHELLGDRLARAPLRWLRDRAITLYRLVRPVDRPGKIFGKTDRMAMEQV